MSNRFKAISCLIIAFFCAYLIISGRPFLAQPILPSFEMPWGNYITWIGFIALPFSLLFGFSFLRKPINATSRILNKLLRLNILLALLWVPLSYFLAGNLKNNFKNSESFQGGPLASEIFWVYCGVLAGLPLLIYIFCWILSLLKRFSTKHKE